MASYYIDYENVGSAGINGVEKLTEQDRVLIFFSLHADTMKIPQIRLLMRAKAQIIFKEVAGGTPNALDFELITMLFYSKRPDEECWIITKDTGYDAAIRMSRSLDIHDVRRAPSIQKALEFASSLRRSRQNPNAPRPQESAHSETGPERAEEAAAVLPEEAASTNEKQLAEEFLSVPDEHAAVVPAEEPTESEAQEASSLPEPAEPSTEVPVPVIVQSVKKRSSRRRRGRGQKTQELKSASEASPVETTSAVPAPAAESPAPDDAQEPERLPQAETAENVPETEAASPAAAAETPVSAAAEETPERSEAGTTAEAEAAEALTEPAGEQPAQAPKKEAAKKKQTSAKKTASSAASAKKRGRKAGKPAEANAPESAQEVADDAEKSTKAEERRTEAAGGADLRRLAAVLRLKCGLEATERETLLVAEGIRGSENRNQFYQFFRKKLGEAEGREFYRHVRAQFDALREAIG